MWKNFHDKLIEAAEMFFSFIDRLISIDDALEIYFYSLTIVGYISLSLLVKFATVSLIYSLFFIVWVLFTLFGITSYIYLRSLRKQFKSELLMRERYALIAMRRFFTYTSQRLFDVARAIDANPLKIKNYNFDSFIRHMKLRITRGIFNQISFGNTNLDIVYRVALMEPDLDEQLKIVTYYNSERLRPRTASLNKGYRIKDGVAGWAWYYRAPFCIWDIKGYLEKLEAEGRLPESVFRDNFPEAKDSPEGRTLLQIQSIICYPIVINEKNGEIVKGVVCIDCDHADILSNQSPNKAKRLRIQLYPYLRLLSLVYGTEEFINSKRSVIQPE